MIIYKDEKFGFCEIFNEENGTLIRSDINGIEPVMRSFPELLDVGIMGHCDHNFACILAGIDCYQNGYSRETPHMSLKDYECIARQASGKTFQIALGGAGDPNKHPAFKNILEITRFYRIVPNLTTSGMSISDYEIGLINQYCGAVAVSWYSRINEFRETNPATIDVTDRLVKAGCITNIHFVISSETIDEAVYRLENNLFPSGINAVIFILYKPVGKGKRSKILQKNDARVKQLIHIVQEPHPFRIGFDTCFTSAILRYQRNIATESIDACEASTFSMYIDSQLNCFPCSFGIWMGEISENLRDKTIREIWNGKVFSEFRCRQKLMCNGCDHYTICQGGCKLGLNIELCE